MLLVQHAQIIGNAGTKIGMEKAPGFGHLQALLIPLAGFVVLTPTIIEITEAGSNVGSQDGAWLQAVVGIGILNAKHCLAQE